jgi:hypothetical protein
MSNYVMPAAFLITALTVLGIGVSNPQLLESPTMNSAITACIASAASLCVPKKED